MCHLSDIPMHGELLRYGDLIEPDSETDSTELCIYIYIRFIYNDLNNVNTELDKR